MSSSSSASKKHRCRGKSGNRGKSGRFEGQSAAYWEARLKRCGLGMDAGSHRDRITYGHMVADLDWDGKVTYVPPTGERLENEEWPISMC